MTLFLRISMTFMVLCSLIRFTNASSGKLPEVGESPQSSQEGSVYGSDFGDLPPVVFPYCPLTCYEAQDDFEIIVRVDVLQHYTQVLKCDAFEGIEFFYTNEYSSDAERDLFENVEGLCLLGIVDKFPKLVSTFEGRLDVLVYLAESFYHEGDLYPLGARVIELLSNERDLTPEKLRKAELFLLTPISFIRFKALEHWQETQDFEALCYHRMVLDAYGHNNMDAFSYMNLRHNIFFFEGLSRFIPDDVRAGYLDFMRSSITQEPQEAEQP